MKRLPNGNELLSGVLEFGPNIDEFVPSGEVGHLVAVGLQLSVSRASLFLQLTVDTNKSPVNLSELFPGKCGQPFFSVLLWLVVVFFCSLVVGCWLFLCSCIAFSLFAAVRLALPRLFSFRFVSSLFVSCRPFLPRLVSSLYVSSLLVSVRLASSVSPCLTLSCLLDGAFFLFFLVLHTIVRSGWFVIVVILVLPQTWSATHSFPWLR